MKRTLLIPLTLIMLASCAPQESQTFQATVPALTVAAPIYTNTPTFTPSPTVTLTPSASPTLTLTLTPSLTPSETPTPSNTPTITPTFTPSPIPTQGLVTLTPVANFGAPAVYLHQPAGVSSDEGWSCGDFPCEDDLAGWLERIQVPERYAVEHVGRFAGQPMQITYGADGRLYATVLENGTRNGAVYAMNDAGESERISETLISPLGLAFQPNTDILYVSARTGAWGLGALYRVEVDGSTTLVMDDLPCCLSLVDNQPNGITFGQDGYLYMGVGSLTDYGEAPAGSREAFVTPQPYEASILRIQPHTGEVEVYAQGIRNPFDLAFDANGTLYATDNGLFSGEGDRVMEIRRGGHHGFPMWRPRGCEACAFTPATLDVAPDLWTFPPYTLPRGIVAYTGNQFPVNLFNSVFVTLWNGVEGAQRVIRIDPRNVPDGVNLPQAGSTVPAWATVTPIPPPEPEAFVTGLIRPIDVVVAPDGTLVIADYVYGHVWRVRYVG